MPTYNARAWLCWQDVEDHEEAVLLVETRTGHDALTECAMKENEVTLTLTWMQRCECRTVVDAPNSGPQSGDC